MTFDALINEGEYFSSFYLDEILPKQLKSGLLKQWAAQERQDLPTPRQGLRDLTALYLSARLSLGGLAEKFNEIVDARAVEAQQFATEALRALGQDDEPPAFQPAAPPPHDDAEEGDWRRDLADWHHSLLSALGYAPRPGHLTVTGATGLVAVPVTHHEPGIVVLTGGFTQDPGQSRGDAAAIRLPAPVRIASGRTLTTVTDLAAWLLTTDDSLRYAVLLFGGVMVLADRENFPRGRHLTVDLDTALPRKGAKGADAGELDIIAALFGAPSLRPREDGSDDEIARLVAESRDHSVGVTEDLRDGLRESVQLIANEILELARDRDVPVHPEDFPEWLPDALKDPDDLPRLLTTEALRYLYRILFLLYAEARPELDILPMKSQEYAAGYSVARLRDLVAEREKLPSTAREGHHFHSSLALLFEKVYEGFPTADVITSREQLTAPGAPVSDALPSAGSAGSGESGELVDDETVALAEDDGYAGVRIEALRSRLFDPAKIKLIGRVIDPPRPTALDGTHMEKLDLRLRNKVLHQVLRNLTVVEGRGKGSAGFISYANLSINHLGAVYEGLMAYTGFIADEPLYEVAKGGDPKGGSWLIRGEQVRSGRYPDGPDDTVFVDTAKDAETGLPTPVPHDVGTYVYRLAGRDRQTSASYYTPASLTEATVEQTLRFRLDDSGDIDPRAPERTEVTAAEVLRWRVCEPALGSGAFLNEAVNQLAELYLRLAQRDTGKDIDPEEYQRELQKAKAYIALHNAYGVDLNETAVELAEVALWLNTMYRGMKAPWYGLHLHRGNSLVGAVRKVYPGQTLSEGGWLAAKDQQRPRHIPLSEPIPGRSVHQFLLPARGWGSIGEKVSLRKPKKNAEDQTVRSVVDGDVVDWLEPDLIERMAKWRSAIRRSPRGAQRRGTAKVGGKATAGAADVATVGSPAPAETAVALEGWAEGEQGLFDLGLPGPEQLTFAAATTPQRGVQAARRVAKAEERQEEAEGRSQTGRLRALARRVEYLWDLVKLRLELSEQEIARDIDVWGVELGGDGDGSERSARPLDRDAVVEALLREGTPYWRLKQLMDAWCALWFWPLEEIGLLDGTDREAYFDGDVDLTAITRGQMGGRKVALKSLDDWIEFAESVVGRADAESEEGKTGLLLEFSGVRGLRQLDDKERELDALMIEQSAWAEALDLGDVFPWYETVRRIARERAFFHWELDYAHVFAQGGFDLMVGNPPWVKQEWKESGVLAEFEPWFELADHPSNEEWAERKADVMRRPEARSAFMNELAAHAAVSGYLASPDAYPELVGTQPDLYRAFMLVAWRATGERGTAGIIHPSTHLTGAKEGVLRRAAYRHLRLHADFVNELYLFAKPVDHSTHFSVNVYGRVQEIRFQHLSWLVHPLVLSRSLRGECVGENPGVKHEGTWDLRPHQERVVTVDRSTLAQWQKLAGEENPPPADEAKLLFPVTVSEESAISALANWAHRLGGLKPRISRGFDEKNDRTAGYFTWDSGPVESWNDVILQGPLFGIATPFAKRPLEEARTTLQVESWNAAALAADTVPRTNYRRAPDCSASGYYAGLARRTWQDHELLAQLRDDPNASECLAELTSDEAEQRAHLHGWTKRPYARFTRMVWRRQIASNTERSLFASLMPPGPAHVHMVHSLALKNDLETALVAGFWAALPLDYFLRATGRSDLQVGEAQTMPAPTPGHPLEDALLLRTLRLNAQTDAYGRLWTKLYGDSWQSDSWAAAAYWSSAPALTQGVGPTWTRDTPLRTEFARRAALVEIDALVAVWLGISADELVAMYNARFPVLQQYEENMWFDATGRRIAKAHQQHGYGQPRDAWKELSSHENYPHEAKVPEGYTGPLYRANRRREMRAAHAEFTRRLRAAGWEPGDTTSPGADE
ncbi:class I SAM-dependent DNA methyltransferase [Streptomyces violaceus]|uniref:Eco57I restriction-modification methylase domain-containing protein n=1 Tax=Streptomyces violaceus TaxID=1936 RepID=UPI002E27D9F2|nr:DNA methyltransferase [Streptomyces violaceus]